MNWFTDGTEYQANLYALINYLPKDDLVALDFWIYKFLPYKLDSDPLGLDNYNGADLTIAAKEGDCESKSAVFVEVVRAWGWEVSHCLVLFETPPHHDCAVFINRDGLPGWWDYGNYFGDIHELKDYLARRYKKSVRELWAVNDIGEKIKRLDK